MSRLIVCAKFINRIVLVSPALVTTMFIAILVAAPGRHAAPGRVQNALLELVQQQPDALVSVIVQKTARDGSVEDLAAKLGSKVTADLTIINAFAAEMRGAKFCNSPKPTAYIG